MISIHFGNFLLIERGKTFLFLWMEKRKRLLLALNLSQFMGNVKTSERWKACHLFLTISQIFVYFFIRDKYIYIYFLTTKLLLKSMS